MSRSRRSVLFRRVLNIVLLVGLAVVVTGLLLSH